MKKLNIVLNETSIINFPFLWKLIKRYMFLSILIPLIVAAYSAYIYMGQNRIYSGSVGFKYITDSSSSASGMIFSMLGEKTSTLDTTEIIAYGNNLDFQYRIAEQIVKQKDYRKLSFNPIGKRKLESFDVIFKSCKGNRDCERDHIARAIRNYYSIIMDQEVIDRYSLHVRALDRNTTDSLVKIISKTVKDDRLSQIRYFVTSQIKISEELLQKKKDEIDIKKVKNILQMQAQNRSKIKSLRDRLGSIRLIYFAEQKKLNLYETELNQLKKVLGKRNRTSSRSNMYKVTEAKNIKKIIVQLRSDIVSIKSSFSGTHVRGSKIIKKLEESLKKNERKLASFGNINEIAMSESFVHDKENSKALSQHNYKISQKQFFKTELEFKKNNERLEALIKKGTELEALTLAVTPNLELIKLLEKKLVQLKLAESTIVSDLVFDNYQSELTTFKQIAKTKMIFISSFFSFFLLLFVILLRYIFDGRIYDEYELKNNFEELEIIGNTPDFH